MFDEKKPQHTLHNNHSPNVDSLSQFLFDDFDL